MMNRSAFVDQQVTIDWNCMYVVDACNFPECVSRCCVIVLSGVVKAGLVHSTGEFNHSSVNVVEVLLYIVLKGGEFRGQESGGYETWLSSVTALSLSRFVGSVDNRKECFLWHVLKFDRNLLFR